MRGLGDCALQRLLDAALRAVPAGSQSGPDLPLLWLQEKDNESPSK